MNVPFTFVINNQFPLRPCGDTVDPNPTLTLCASQTSSGPRPFIIQGA
jgi:hypothetical protein